MKQCRQGNSARGSHSLTRRLSMDCSSCFYSENESPRAGRGTNWEWFLLAPSQGIEKPTQY
uniref:Uncharacterized protein n=1 Tax=Solanum lycopersicum TaxID=4081 RepID=A0A3Q7H886_SOLLC